MGQEGLIFVVLKLIRNLITALIFLRHYIIATDILGRFKKYNDLKKNKARSESKLACEYYVR